MAKNRPLPGGGSARLGPQQTVCAGVTPVLRFPPHAWPEAPRGGGAQGVRGLE